ncbi:hypothetical protein AB395_00006787 (plasmid) [Sinorhizobium fredii CCBAU 45436]|nr:hypothetical protein AB395_00006787 [Sinorhizobium fredii CCBAU 45436]
MSPQPDSRPRQLSLHQSADNFTVPQESLEPLGLLFHWYAFCVHLSREVNVPRIRRNIFYSGVRPPLIHTPFHISRFL